MAREAGPADGRAPTRPDRQDRPTRPDGPTGRCVVPATADRWPDVELLLGSGGERGCWCQSWRGASAAFGRSDPGDNRDRLRCQVEEGPAPGVLAYLDGVAVGWCGLGPRASMPRLMRSRTIPIVDDVAVWSIGCFVVRAGLSPTRSDPRPARRRGRLRAVAGSAGDRGLPDRSG